VSQRAFDRCPAIDSNELACTDLWGIAVIVLMLGSLSAFAAENPATTAGTCPPNQREEVSLDEGVAVRAPAGFDAMGLYDTATHHMLKPLLLDNNTWNFTWDDLNLTSSIKYGEKEKVRLGWTKRDEGENSPVCVQPFRVQAYPAVMDVVCDEPTCRAGLGDQMSIQVRDLDSWIKKLRVVQGGQTPQTVGDLVPFFDGTPIPGIHPENPGAQPDEFTSDFRPYHTLRYTLERNESNRKVWTRFLRGLKWDGTLLDVSVGFEGGDKLPSWVQKDTPPRSDPNYSYYKKFELVVLPHGSTVLAAVLFFTALFVFFWLVRATEILQDANAPLRPDGQPPYSLARVQMAVWFFLVVAAWFLLFLVTKDIDTLNGSVLVLIGISAATAVGSAIMDAGTTIDAAGRVRNVPADPKGLGQRVSELRDKLESTRRRPTAGNAEEEAKRAELERLAAELSLTESQQTFFHRRPWLRVIYDLLGDDGHISFHRFQIAVWTLVLAFVFVTQLLSELTMPEFSANVLGLMGISSGAYLGFKLPAASAAGVQAKS